MHVRNVLPTDLFLGPLQQNTTQLGCAVPKTTKVHCLRVCRPGVQNQGLGRADGLPPEALGEAPSCVVQPLAAQTLLGL